MKILPIRRWPISLFLLWLCVAPSLTVSAAEVKLLVRTPITAPKIAFDAKTKAWLASKPQIRVAFWGGAQPPLHMGFEPDTFEGVTADVLALLQQMLGVPIQMRRFANRSDAQQALARGQVDVLALNDVTVPESPFFKPSVPYLLNHKVTIRRINAPDKPRDDLYEERLAYIATTDPHVKRIQDQFPHSKLVRYVNHMNALTGLAYDQVDAFRTNAVTAEFLLSSLAYNNLYIADAREAPHVADINFAVNSQQPQLLEAINQSLVAIPVADMLRITANWGLSNNFIIARKSLVLTDEQRAWIAENPKLKVAVVGTYAPLTFFDDKNRFNGLSADMLKLITRLTGLEFEVVRSDSISDMLVKLQDHKVDLIASLSISDFRLKRNQYTRPYLISPFVVVTRRSEADIKSLSELNGLRLAIPWGNPLSQMIQDELPEITAVKVHTATEGLEMLAASKVDASVHTLLTADYFINHHFQADLHIASVIGARPARVAMAVGPDKQILKDIINTALLEVTPEEYRAMVNRWDGKNLPAVASSWNNYKDVVYVVVAGSILFGLAFLIWNHYLRINIQKRQKAERELEDQLHFTRTLVDGAPVALYVRDSQGRLIQCNQAYLDFFDKSREQIIGKTLIESQTFSEEFNARYHQIYLEILKSGQPVFTDIDVEVNGKSHRIYHWTLPFHNSNSQYIGIIGGWLDITEREHLIEKLNLATDAAISANRSKSAFLASMSHEIRTPVSALVGLIELMRLEGVSASQIEENMEVAHQSAQSLLSLIGDILDLSKIEAGEMAPAPQPTDLNEMGQSIFRLFETNARKKNLDYRLAMELRNSGIIIDGLMLNQVVANLLSNAIKFTDQGSVQLLLRELPSDLAPGRARFAIQVSDTGKGLSESQRQEIFEPFVQAEPQAHRALGTGLGLSICASLAKLLDAQLTVDSQLGLGSRFTLMFEADLVEINESPAAIAPESQSNHKLRILVVEDHAANRLLLCRQLEYLGHEALPCEDGEAALAQWMNAEPPFDLTITDCNMLRMDGYELSRSIRDLEQQRALSPHPIFGLTANAQAEIIERCLEAGMTRCLFKPVSIETLTGLISEVEQSTKRRAQAANNNGSELDKIRLLSPESYGPLVNELVLAHRQEGQELERLALLDDRAGLARVAHKIRGGAQLAGDDALAEACRVIEQSGHEVDSPEYGRHVDDVLVCLQALEARLLQNLASNGLLTR